jgi:hypothetical protein
MMTSQSDGFPELEWEITTHWGVDYETAPPLNFTQRNKNPTPRGNILFALRDLTHLWHGEIAYNPITDQIHPEGVTDNTTVWWYESGILLTTYSPLHQPNEVALDWIANGNSGETPKAILFQYITEPGMTLHIRTDLVEDHGLAEAMSQNACLCSDHDEEVRVLQGDTTA